MIIGRGIFYSLLIEFLQVDDKYLFKSWLVKSNFFIFDFLFKELSILGINYEFEQSILGIYYEYYNFFVELY